MGDFAIVRAVSGAEPTTRFFWIRHGRVADAWQGRIYGDLDVPLSEAGKEEARRAAGRLEAEPLDLVVSSGLTRAEFGAALLRAPRGLSRRDEPELREIGRGLLRGKFVTELQALEAAAWRDWLEQPGARRLPGGESLEDLAARVLPRVHDLAAEHQGGRIAVVSHSWVLRVVVCETLALPLDVAPRLAIPTGGMVVVDWPTGPARERPTLAGFALDAPPAPGTTWFRGPRPPPG